MDDCTKETPAGGGRTREVNDRELRRKEKGPWDLACRYVGVTLQKAQQQNETERPRGFYRREVFRSGESIFLVDRNPIWTTEPRLGIRTTDGGAPGTMGQWPRLGRLQDTRRTRSAAAPGVAFPAVLLAAARGFGIMTEYSRAGCNELNTTFDPKTVPTH
jgi:hypothetical protein